MGMEVPTRMCAYCHEDKPWIFGDRRLKDGTKIYTNEKGIRWSGRRCPDCERLRVQAALKSTGFDQSQVEKKLRADGYVVVDARTNPVKVKTPSGVCQSVGICHATATDEGIILHQSEVEGEVDLYAVVFSSVKLLSEREMQVLGQRAERFVPTDRRHSSSAPQPSN